MKKIQISETDSGSQISLEIEKNIVIVGANGAGKSRFGSKLEQINNPSKRISAQRHLQLNEVVQRQDFETADSQLRGSYKNQPVVQPQGDYQQVLISLFAQESKRDSEYVAGSRLSETKINVPQSTKEDVVDIWNFVFPYRRLKLENDRVRAINDLSEFSGTEMSDGEKVGLYLISQVLLAEKDCILIIDEPELHLHKALMVRLWNKLEEHRSDCTFIYITHDLDFAVSKPASKIIWIQNYKDGMWNWKELGPNDVIPENLFLEVLGSRKPILFVEGEKGSLDAQLYQSVYDEFTVVPSGSCEKVIESVKGLKNNTNLHDKKVYGLIDRDFRPDEQLRAFKEQGIFATSLNKVENFFLVPEIIKIVCGHLLKTDKEEIIYTEIKNIYEMEKKNIEFAASKYRIQRKLNEMCCAVKNSSDYDAFKKEIIEKLDQEIVTVQLPDKENLVEILKVYPNKGLVRQIQDKIELTGEGYRNLVLALLSSEKRQEIKDILKLYLPEILT